MSVRRRRRLTLATIAVLALASASAAGPDCKKTRRVTADGFEFLREEDYSAARAKAIQAALVYASDQVNGPIVESHREQRTEVAGTQVQKTQNSATVLHGARSSVKGYRIVEETVLTRGSGQGVKVTIETDVCLFDVERATQVSIGPFLYFDGSVLPEAAQAILAAFPQSRELAAHLASSPVAILSPDYEISGRVTNLSAARSGSRDGGDRSADQTLLIHGSLTLQAVNRREGRVLSETYDFRTTMPAFLDRDVVAKQTILKAIPRGSKGLAAQIKAAGGKDTRFGSASAYAKGKPSGKD